MRKGVRGALFILAAIAAACKVPSISTPAPTPAPLPSPTIPVVNYVGTVTIVPQAATPVPAETCNGGMGLNPDCNTAFGPGKEQYCMIYKAWVKRYGCAPTGKVWWAIDAATMTSMQAILAAQSNGIGPLYGKYGCDPKGWKKEPASIPLFGAYTGAQHEFGGNDFLAAAAKMDGFDDADMGQWLLWAHYNAVPHYSCKGVDIK